MAIDHATARQPSDEWIEVDGVQLHYLTAGSGETPVLLLHGGIVDAASLSWGGTVGPLAEDRRVIALDMPGYGNSSRPDVTYSTQFHIDVVDEFLDKLGLHQVSLVGVSTGGGVALGYALQSPATVEKLVLADSYGLGDELPHGKLTYALSRLPQLNRLSLALLRRSRFLARLSLANVVYDLDSLSSQVVDEFHQLLQQPDAGKAYRQWRKHEIQRSGFRTDYSHRLDDVQAPTLLVHGAEDGVFPVSWSRRARAAIPNARLEVFSECGHWPPRERTDEFNQVVASFLSE